MEEQVIAKFKVDWVEDQPDYAQKTVQLSAVYNDGGNENASFSKYTPSGTLNMMISYETRASDFFKQGEEIYLTFSKTRE